MLRKNKHILDFRNYILEKLNNTMYNLHYNISYIELDFDKIDTFTNESVLTDCHSAEVTGSSS